jgi:hypothetical protein
LIGPCHASVVETGLGKREPSTVLLGRALKPRPAAMAKSARKASAATIHGRELDLDSRTGAAAPTAVPQRWQNFAAALSSAEHAAHVAPVSGEPQLAQ